MALSPLFGWEEPDDVDLVKDGAAAMRTLGNAIDTSMGDLLGGTSGQILSKASATDMDFAWITNDVGDITAVTAGTGISGGGTSGAVTITNSMATEITAKGDVIVGTGSATFDNLAVGANGTTLVADSTTATGLRYQGNFSAGKNKIINGDFGIWQRGTSFSYNVGGYTADRYIAFSDAGGTVSQQTFTPGTAPVAGYESQFFIRLAKSAGGSFGNLVHKIEDVRTFAGQTATYSFWAKAGSAQTFNLRVAQNFGSGGSGSVTLTEQTVSVTTSWARYSATFAIPSVSGKTIGTSSYLEIQPYWFTASALNVDIWGVQVEAGSVATAFQTATGTIQGELAACQRYFYRAVNGADNLEEFFSIGQAYSTSATVQILRNPVVMRTNPTLTVSSGSHFQVLTSTYSTVNTTGVSADKYSPRQTSILMTGASGLTAGNASGARTNSASATLDLSAEL